MAELFVNGKSAGILWKKPFRVNIGGLIKTGENDLKIEVVNMWINRLTGDMKLYPKDRHCKTNQPDMTRESWPGVMKPSGSKSQVCSGL